MAKGLDAQQEIFASNPADRRAFEALEEHYFLDGDWEALVEVYRRRLTAQDIVDDDAQQAPLLFRLGQILEERILDIEAATEVYWSLARLDPTNRPALRQLRGIHERAGKWDLVLQIAELESATAMPPYDRAAFETELGRVWQHHLDDVDEARCAFERALEADPEFPAALEGLSALHREAGRFQESAAVLTRLTERLRGPERAPVWIALGTLYATHLENPSQARACFERALEDDPYQPPAVEWSLLLATKDEDWNAVSDLLERRFDLASGARHRAAIAVEASQIQLNHVRSHAGARAWIDRALELSADEAAVLLAAAEVERADDDPDAVLEILDRVIGLTGHAAPRSALVEFAELNARLGHPDRALETIRRVNETSGQEDVRVLTLQAKLLREAGETNEAEQNQELADVLEILTALDAGVDDTDRVRFLAELARLQEEDLGDPESAEASWRRTFELDPSHADAFAALERMLRKSDDWDGLRELFEVAYEAAEEGDRAPLAVALGTLLLDQFDEPERARERFESVLAGPSDVASVRLARAGLRRIAEQSDDGELLLRICAEDAEDCNDPDEMAALARAAIPLLEEGDRVGEALDWAKRWSKLDPNSRDAFRLRAQYEQTLGDVDAELETRRRLSKLLDGAERATCLRRQAELHRSVDDADGATTALELALEIEPGETDTLNVLCSVYREQGRSTELVRTLRLLTDALPASEQVGALEELAETLQEEIGDLDAAVVVRWQLAEQPAAPDDADEKLEALLETTGRYAELAQLLDTRRQQIGDESEAAFDLDLRRARILLDSLGQSERAAEILSVLHERHPQNEDILDQLERALRVGDDAQGLCDLIERRADWETDPSRKSAMHLERASLLEEVLGEPLLAADLFERIIEDHAGSEEASTASVRLEQLLESSGQWERLRDRLVAQLEGLTSEDEREQEATLRERIAAICHNRLHDLAGCAEQLECIAEIVTDRVHVWQQLAELYADELDRPADWLRVTEAELETGPSADRELSLRVAAARLTLDEDRRPSDRQADEAYPHYERVLALNPAHAEAAEVLAHYFTSVGRHEDTVRVLEGRLGDDVDTGSGETHTLRLRIAAVLSDALEDDERARPHLEAARVALGATPAVADPLAALYERTESFDELGQLAREVIDANPNEAGILCWRMRLGLSEQRCGNLEAAASAYRAALLSSPDDREIEDALVELYDQLGETEPLTNLLEKRLPYAAEEEAIDLRLRLAELNGGPGEQPRQALEHLEWILASHPQHRDAFERAVELADRLGESERILAMLDRALQLPQPAADRADLLVRRGTLFADAFDRPEQAVSNFREAIAIEADNPDAQRALRLGLEKLGRWPAVLDCLFVEASAADPDRRIEIFEQAAELAWSRVNPDASLPWLARLREARPDDRELLARTAEVHRRAGRFEAALRAYDQELELCQDDQDAERQYELHIQRARLLERELHAPGRAIFAYLKARQVASDETETLAELDRLYDTMDRPFERADILEARVARLGDAEGIELRQTLSAIYCIHLSKPELAIPHLEANVAATRDDPREEIQHLGALDAALRAARRHDAWARVAEREVELIESNVAIRESTPVEYLCFLREELARTYDALLGAPDRAIVHLQSLVGMPGETRPRVFEQLRDLFRRTGRCAELAENLSAHLQANAGTSEEWLELGRLREEKLVDLSGAIDAYRAAEADALDPLQAIRGRRRCFERLRDWSGVADALEAEYQQSESLDRRERIATARRLGEVCGRRLADGDRAAAGYNRALDLDPSDLDTIRALTAVTEANRDPAEAILLYHRELELLGSDPEDRKRSRVLWLKLASAHGGSDASTDSTSEAIAAYLEADRLERLSATDEIVLARLYETDGQIEAFCDVFGRWCDRDDSGSSVADHLELARQHQIRDEIDAAQQRAERATAVAPESSAAWSLLAELKRAEGEHEEAADAFERAADHAEPESAALHLASACDCIRAIDIDRAWSLLERARPLDPGALEVHVAATHVASQLDKLDETFEAAEAALELARTAELTPERQLEIALLGGRAAGQLGHRDASRRLFETVIAIDPDQIEALEGIALAHYDDGDFSCVRAPLEHRLQLPGSNPLCGRHHAMVARGLEADDLLDAAWTRYEEAIELDDTLDEAHEGLVRVHERASRLAEAALALERWAQTGSDSARRALASLQAGEHALAAEENARAEENLRRAVTLDPELAPAWLLLCQLVGDQGIDRETRRLCEDALDVLAPGPHSAQIALRAARLAEVAGENDEAIKRYGEAMRWDPRCSDAALCQSRLIRMSGDWIEANAVLSQFADDHPDPDSPTLAQVHLERGRLLAGPLEDVEPAIAAYEQALAIQPDLRVATTALAGLLMHSRDRWREALALHREILTSSPTTAGSLRAVVGLAQLRGQRETEDAALAVLRALGLASPQEAGTAPSGLRVPIHPGPPMATSEAERMRRIAYQLREELAEVLATSGTELPVCDDADVREAMTQIQAIEDELSAPNLARLDADDRRGLFSEVAALFLDPGGNGGESRYRDALDRSLGRWTRRKIRRLVEETSLSEIEAIDFQVWADELRAMAAAQVIDRNGGDLRTVLRALLLLDPDEDASCPPEGVDIGTRVIASEPARRLLTRINTMLCERLEHAG